MADQIDSDLDQILAEHRATMASVTADDLNPKQRKTLDLFISQVAERNARTGNTEQKSLELTKTGENTVFVSVEYGMPGDEGTMAAVFCRDHRHVAIRRMGGISILNGKKPSYKHGMWNAVHQLTR